MADEWNLNKPVNSTLISDLPLEHRRRKTNVAAVLEKEHATLGDSNIGGEHKQGSAVMWHLSTANIPALQLDGTALASSDNGRLWHDTTTDIIYVLNDYSDPTVDGGWVAIGHYLGDIAINTDKFTVARATGNTDIDGTLDVVGDFNPTAFANTNGGFLDEDAMNSDDATAVASQQSIKAFGTMVPAVTGAGTGVNTSSPEESYTSANGLIMKMGITGAIGATGSTTVTFGAAFPNNLINVQLSLANSGAFYDTAPSLTAKSVSAITIKNGSATAGMIVYWQAWGN